MLEVTKTIKLTREAADLLDQNNKRHGDMGWNTSEAIVAYFKPAKPIPCKPLKPKFDPVAAYSNDLRLHQQAWAAWCEKRREMKKPLTEKAAKAQVELLTKYGIEDQRKIIWKSIQNDYQGLFEIKVQTDERKLSLSEQSAASTQRLLENGEDALYLLGSDDPFIRAQVGVQGRGLSGK